MTWKIIYKWLPKSLLIFLIFTFIISALDGIVLSEVVGRISNFDTSSTFSEILQYGLFSFSAFSLVYIAMYFKRRIIYRAIRIINTTLKKKFIENNLYKNKPIGNTSTHISTLLNDFKLLETNYFNIFFDTIFLVLMGIFSSIYMLSLSIPIGLSFIVMSFLPMITAKIFKNKITLLSKDWTSNSEHFVQKISDVFNGLNIIKTYKAEEKMLENTAEQLSVTEGSYEQMNNTQLFANTISSILSVLSFMLPTLLGLIFVSMNEIEAGAIIGMFLASDRVVGPFRQTSRNLNTMRSTSNIREKIGKMLKENENLTTQKTQIDFQHPDIQFNQVSFFYDTDIPIFNKLNLSIDYGEKILITGKSGSGKTTILNLIQGLIEPTSGSIKYQDGNKELFNNEIIKTNIIARIQQEPFIFYENIKFNLTMGSEFSDEACLKVLDQVGLTTELGMDCLTKNYGENGKDLSGGQKQRVEIARALLHNKQVLLVDEATSALDRKAAQKVRDVLWNLPGTVIEIAHHYDLEELKKSNIKHYHLTNQNLN